MENKQDLFEILRKIRNKPESSQRELAKELGFSLGKLNYCLKELQKKGFVKIHILTQKGIKYRVELTLKFMNRKMKEYDQLKKEISKDKIINL